MVFYEFINKKFAKNWFVSELKKGIDWNYYKNQYKSKESRVRLIKDLSSNKFYIILHIIKNHFMVMIKVI